MCSKLTPCSSVSILNFERVNADWVCGESVYRPLNIIFKTCLNTGNFPLEWKKGNVVPIHKKYDKRNVKKYRSVSRLPICGKIFERLIYLLSEDNLLFPNQPGFR